MPLLDIKPYDRQYYETVLRPFLPRTFIDCHAHIWLHEFHREGGLREGSQNWPRLVAKENPIEDLKETNRLLFPENQVISVVYGDPVVTIDRERNNRYVAEKARAKIVSRPCICRIRRKARRSWSKRSWQTPYSGASRSTCSFRLPIFRRTRSGSTTSCPKSIWRSQTGTSGSCSCTLPGRAGWPIR